MYGRIISLDYKGREKTIILNDIYQIFGKNLKIDLRNFFSYLNLKI